ncbi:PadR family transcriptional regulator [Actinoplanes sp. NPDC020271]|uniref:PadR family transcriptional regulator n=1 Tax=Actinoplanes sp. NPDC020271 TaxID=3363896 RepID=UPI003791D853
MTSSMREPTFWALTVLASGPHHGYGLIREADRLSGGRVRLQPGTLYATLARSAPWWLWAMTVAGALAGLTVGWLLTGWISRRTEGDSGATFIAVLPAWLCALPLTLGALPLNEQVGRPWPEGVFVGLHAKLVPGPTWASTTSTRSSAWPSPPSSPP